MKPENSVAYGTRVKPTPCYVCNKDLYLAFTLDSASKDVTLFWHFDSVTKVIKYDLLCSTACKEAYKPRDPQGCFICNKMVQDSGFIANERTASM